MASRRMRIKAVANVPSFNKGGRDRPTTPTPNQINISHDLRNHPPSPYLPPESPSSIIPSSPRPSPSISPMVLFSPGSPTKKYGSFAASYSPVPSPQRSETPKTPLTILSSYNEDSSSRKSVSTLDIHQSNSNSAMPITTFGDISYMGNEGEFQRPRSSLGLSNTISALQKEFPNNSSESLRQRLAKVPNLTSTSKYATVRKEFINKFKVHSTKDVKVPSTELTMLHYAFWNPPSEIKKEKIEEDKADEFPKMTLEKLIPITEEPKEEKKESITSGPRVKVGPDGQLIIDEKSLLIESSETKRAKEQIDKMEVVSAVPSGFYRMKRGVKRGNDWSVKETVRFYRALSTCGSDFSMMTHLFPHRTRAELKAKFKREDRRNPIQVSKALSSQCFDPLDALSSESEEETKSQEGDSVNPDFEIGSMVEKKEKKIPAEKHLFKKGRPRIAHFNQRFSTDKDDENTSSCSGIVKEKPIKSPVLSIPSTSAANVGIAIMKRKLEEAKEKPIKLENEKGKEKKKKKDKSEDRLSMPLLHEVTAENELIDLGSPISEPNKKNSRRKSSVSVEETSKDDPEIIKLELAESQGTSNGQAKVVPYRVPGPGGNNRGTISNVIDEIEFEISCQ